MNKTVEIWGHGVFSCLQISWIHSGSCFGLNHNTTKHFQKLPQNNQNQKKGWFFFFLFALLGGLFLFFKSFKIAEELVNPHAACGKMKKEHGINEKMLVWELKQFSRAYWVNHTQQRDSAAASYMCRGVN